MFQVRSYYNKRQIYLQELKNNEVMRIGNLEITKQTINIFHKHNTDSDQLNNW